MCGWQVKLCDPLVTHGPYLSALEIRLSVIKRYANGSFTLLYFASQNGYFWRTLYIYPVKLLSISLCLPLLLTGSMITEKVVIFYSTHTTLPLCCNDAEGKAAMERHG